MCLRYSRLQNRYCTFLKGHSEINAGQDYE